MAKQTQKNFWLTAKTADEFDRCHEVLSELFDRSIKQGELADAALSLFTSLPIEEQKRIVADWFFSQYGES